MKHLNHRVSLVESQDFRIKRPIFFAYVGEGQKIHFFPLLILSLLLSFALVIPAHAQVGNSNPNQSGTTGLQGKVSSPPPTTPATITTPTSGRSFNTTPITVSGLCKTDCAGGSYSIQVDMFGGSNELVAKVYDALDQEGPESNKVTVTFQDTQFAAFGQRITLSSNLAKLGAPVGSQLTWPIILSGGTGPYAISVDWGDGSEESAICRHIRYYPYL